MVKLKRSIQRVDDRIERKGLLSLFNLAFIVPVKSAFVVVSMDPLIQLWLETMNIDKFVEKVAIQKSFVALLNYDKGEGNSVMWDLGDCMDWCGPESDGTHSDEPEWNRSCMMSCQRGITL